MKAPRNQDPAPDIHFSKKIYVSAEVIAEKYGVSPRYILKLAAQGKIPHLRLGKKCVRFYPQAVAKAIGDESQESNQTA